MKTVYFDASAIAKLTVLEAGSLALIDLLAEPCRAVTSALSRAEVVRTVLRLGRSRDDADAALTGFFLVALDPNLLQQAGLLSPARMRTLDAIHLASALSIREPNLDFITYDHHLADAARASGLHVVQPGL